MYLQEYPRHMERDKTDDPRYCKLETDDPRCDLLAPHLSVNGRNGSSTGHIQQTEHHQRVSVCRAESHRSQQGDKAVHPMRGRDILDAKEHAAA